MAASFLTHFPITPINRFLYSHKPKTLIKTLTTLSTSPSLITTHEQEITLIEETPLQIPKEKLFIPPETEINPEKGPRILRGSNIVLSKYAKDAQVVSAEFVKSSVETEACPNDGSPEFAFVGRSNVGKSSLVNSIVKRKKLALTSKKPGKTQCINHFRINNSWYLVDLPGYGYASAPNELRKDWNKFTKDYFLNRSTLVSVFLLIDASIPAKKIDLEYASWLSQNQVPMTLIFTKCDKRKKKKNGGKHPEENVQDFQELISKYFEAVPPWIMTSSLTNQGVQQSIKGNTDFLNYANDVLLIPWSSVLVFHRKMDYPRDGEKEEKANSETRKK
nr:GTP-binding protein At2g22870 [Tanacetum cinerariifolium]